MGPQTQPQMPQQRISHVQPRPQIIQQTPMQMKSKPPPPTQQSQIQPQKAPALVQNQNLGDQRKQKQYVQPQPYNVPLSGHQIIVPIPSNVNDPSMQYFQQPSMFNTQYFEEKTKYPPQFSPSAMSIATVEPTKYSIHEVLKYDGHTTSPIAATELEFDDATGKFKPHPGYTFVEIKPMADNKKKNIDYLAKAANKMLTFNYQKQNQQNSQIFNENGAAS